MKIVRVESHIKKISVILLSDWVDMRDFNIKKIKIKEEEEEK